MSAETCAYKRDLDYGRYRLDEKTGLIDYDELEKFAQRFRPKLLICGYSA